MAEPTLTRAELISALNSDLAREYQAVIAYVVYSQVIKGAEYMAIARELEQHAARSCRTRSRFRSTSTTSAARRRPRRSR